MTPAIAGTAEEIVALPVLDSLNRTEEVFSNGGKWSALAWDSSTTGHNTGRDTTTGWGPYDAFPIVNGAYWNSSSFSDKTGNAAAVTMQVSPGGAERYVALWLDMPSPGSAKTGYQLRWTVVSGTTYSVTLSKYSAGSQTVLGSNSAVTIPAGATLAISDTGGTVTAWQGSGGSLTSILTTADSTFSSGYAGFDGSGNISRSTNFKAGNLSGGGGVPPDTTISSGPKGVVVPNLSFGFTSTEGGSVFECSLDGGAYGACVSPKAYQGVVEGSRIFRVRAVGTGGKDETPAERGFQVVQTAKATTKTTLLDSLERSEVPLATGKWSKSAWAGAIGGAWMGSYRGYGSSSGLAGAYWNPTTFSDGEGTALVAGTVGTGSVPAGQYSALLLNMPNPAGVRSGYEARFTGTGSATNYTVELAKWVAGTRTVLASTTGFSLPVGTTIVLTETAGGSLALWTGTTSLSAVLSASDFTYISGYAGLEVNGGAGTVYNFRAGRIDIQAPDTTITSGPTGSVLPAAVSFAFSSTESGSNFECSLDGAAYSACSSPKAYPTIGGGPHTFRVRSVDAVGNQDLAPAERGFQVIRPPSATTTAATAIKANEANLNATVNPQGSATTYRFEYGTTTSYSSKIPASPKSTGSGTSNVSVSETPTGFTEGATYHFRVVAESVGGTTYGQDMTVTTPYLPAAVTETPEAVEANEATLSGTVDPNGTETEYHFEYGPTAAYGTAIAPDEAGDGNQAIKASEAIGGLQPEATYHYRIVARSQAGVDYGEDKTLITDASTSSVPPTPLPGDFFGMQWTGDFGQTSYPHVLSAIKNSGARILRLVLYRDPALQPKYEEIFRGASQRGITILPYLGDGVWPTDPNEQNSWKEFAKEMVKKYGPAGTFWNGKGHPVSAWEIWNEPNLPTNSPFPNSPDPKSPNAPYEKIAAGQFGTFFHKVAEGLKQGAGGHSIDILVPGLFGFNSSNCNKGECHLSPVDFLGQMGHTEDYDGVSLHPYVFKVNGESDKSHAPTGPNQIGEVKEKVENFIRDVHNKLKSLNQANDGIWVTELGFPVKYPSEDPAFPGVSDAVQKEEIEATFGMMKAKRDELGIAHAFAYDIQDYRCSQWSVQRTICGPVGKEIANWAYHSGLRKGAGGNRPSWRAFAALTPKGHPNWSSPKKAQNTQTNRKARQAISTYDIETQGAQYFARAEWGAGPLSSSYPNATEWQVVEAQDEGEGEEEPVEVEASTTIPGLEPEQVYHYLIAVKNENGEIEREATGHQFETKPAITAAIRTLNGEPGWVNVSGHVESETPITGPYVNINFKKKEGGVYVFNEEESTHATLYNGDYSLENWQIGKGDWQVNVVFPGNAQAPQAETGLEAFTVKNGYQLVAKHSQKCLDVYNGSTGEGAPMIQYKCLSPQSSRNQVFTLVPQTGGGAYYQIVARHSNRCVGVTAGSQTQGVQLSQTECLGPAWTHQIWQGVPIEGGENPYGHFIAKHSGQCMEVQTSSQADGGIVGQYGCAGVQENQLWNFKSVESDPVPQSTYLTIDEKDTLYGEPGYVTFHGTVDTYGSAYPLAGKKVYVHFERKDGSGQYQPVPGEMREVTLDAAGYYKFFYWGIGGGDWRARAVFPANGPLAQDESDYHSFHIGSGYRFEFRHSNKCLSTSGNGKTSGTQLIQWTCAPVASSGDGQVFSVVPVAPAGSGYFQLRPNSAPAQCVDVYGADPANDALLKLYQCTTGAANQEWLIIPLAGQSTWFASIAKHSNKCMDVYGNNPSNGGLVDQWTCVWSGNQQWRWHKIG